MARALRSARMVLMMMVQRFFLSFDIVVIFKFNEDENENYNENDD